MKASIKWSEDFCKYSDTRTAAERELDEAIFENFEKQQRESVELEIKSPATRPTMGLIFDCPCIVKPLVLKVKL